MHAFEIMNGDTSKGGFDDYNPRVYDDFLSVRKMIYCIGADDNHNPFFTDAGLQEYIAKCTHRAKPEDKPGFTYRKIRGR